jgi:hypothetical protein
MVFAIEVDTAWLNDVAQPTTGGSFPRWCQAELVWKYYFQGIFGTFL